MLTVMSTKRKEMLIHSACAAAVGEERRRVRLERENRERRERDDRLGTRVIAFGNGDSGLVVGKITDWLDKGSNIPIIYDYIDQKEYTCFGKVLAFTDQKLRALYKLSPEERWALCAENAVYDREVSFKNNCDSLTLEEMYTTLRENGFFESNGNSAQKNGQSME